MQQIQQKTVYTVNDKVFNTRKEAEEYLLWSALHACIRKSIKSGFDVVMVDNIVKAIMRDFEVSAKPIDGCAA